MGGVGGCGALTINRPLYRWDGNWNGMGRRGYPSRGRGGAPFNPFAFQSPPIPMLFFRLDAPVLLRLNNNSQAKDPFDRALQMKFNLKLH